MAIATFLFVYLPKNIFNMDKHLLQRLKSEKALFTVLNIKRVRPNVIDKKFLMSFFSYYEIAFINAFFEFLKSNGISKEELMHEIKLQNKHIHTDYIPRILTCSLTWSRTKRGHNFWCGLHYEWAQYLRDNVIQPLFGEKLAKDFYYETISGYHFVYV